MAKTATFKFDMGEEVKDKVTGYVGFVVGRFEHVTGCNTYAAQRKYKANEEIKASEHFDEVRLVSTGKHVNLDIVQPEPKTGAMPLPKGVRGK